MAPEAWLPCAWTSAHGNPSGSSRPPAWEGGSPGQAARGLGTHRGFCTCPTPTPAPQDSPSYLLLPHFPTELLASPAEPAPTSPGLSAALSLPAPWAPSGLSQRPAEYTGTATAIAEKGSLACTGHTASSRSPLSEKRRQSPKARGNRPGALLTLSQGPSPREFRGCPTSA